MNILILGAGGREHTFAHKLAQSPHCTKLFVAPGNAGTSNIAENVQLEVTDFDAVKQLVVDRRIEMVVVGPEGPLVNGIQNFFAEDDVLKKVQVVGPSKRGALLEGSKERAKEFMALYNIPTAAYQSFTKESLASAKKFLQEMTPPFVLKADGLAGGKGVLILDDLEEAQREVENMLSGGKFGEAGATVVIEEFLNGIELSIFVLTDGSDYKILPTAKDYKRIGEGDTGLNTGGMGAISPVPFADEVFMEKVEERIIKPTVKGLSNEGIDYKGFIFIGLIKVDNEPFVIEYNVRMGDPETEVVLPRIASDLVEVFLKLGDGKLNEVDLEFIPEAAATVMLVSGGYPGAYDAGKEISGLESVQDVLVFHAGTKKEKGKVLTSGGRVVAVTAFGEDHKNALAKSYSGIENIKFDQMYYRKDIGFDLSEE